ncbi:MAG: hypothetical protein JWP61_2484 [Friedmanniella sp.]|nr:hypothetical protein [Friedmanniella sp.]
MATRDTDVEELVAQLEEVRRTDGARYRTYRVSGHTFGYLWPATQTVGLRQLLAEQLALVAERPTVFEVQFTSGAYGWVVAHLAGLDRAELAELVYEAWRLTADPVLVAARAEALPT